MSISLSDGWVPTHRITWRPARGAPVTCEVMLDDGPAYTLLEWRAHADADWELIGGEWRFQGQPTPGGAPGTVDVEALQAEESTSDGP